MIKTVSMFAIILGLFPLTTSVAWGQANVDESKETAYVYVNGTKGSDSNPGTQLAPFKTIGRAASVAVTNNQQGVGTRVTILPGTYREGITYWGGPKDTALPITFEAATSGTVTVSGADVWAGWQVYGANSQIFTHSWPYKWGLCTQVLPSELDIVRRREMVFVNGTKLTQVLSFSQMVEGTFYVDEGHSVVYTWPASGTTMGTATVEVAVRPSLLEIHEKQNWVVRGLDFQYANGCRQSQPAVIFTGDSSNILIDNDKFLWNNAEGLDFNSVSYVTAQNSIANHNGETGIIGWQAKYSLFESDEGSYNNWRGAQGSFYGSEAGGAKFMSIHDGTVRGLRALFNLAHGVHWDTDNINVTADSLVVSNNFWSGASIEATEGPLTFSNNLLCNNNPQNWPYNGGIDLVDASYVTLSGNTLFHNGGSQIIILGRPNGINVTNYETGLSTQVYNQKLVATNSLIDGTGSQQAFMDGYLAGTSWSMFVTTLASDYNTWWNSSTTLAFTVPVPTGNTKIDFLHWKSLTNRDAHSTFVAPNIDPSTSCKVTPDAADFWFVVGPTSSSLTIKAGGKASYTVSVVPLAFSGTVSLRSNFQIPGASGSFNSTSIDTSGSSTFTVTTSSQTPPGTYQVVMIATSGSLARTITVPLIVQ